MSLLVGLPGWKQKSFSEDWEFGIFGQRMRAVFFDQADELRSTMKKTS